MAAMETDEMNGAEDLGVVETAPEPAGSPLEPDLTSGSFIKVMRACFRFVVTRD